MNTATTSPPATEPTAPAPSGPKYRLDGFSLLPHARYVGVEAVFQLLITKDDEVVFFDNMLFPAAPDHLTRCQLYANYAEWYTHTFPSYFGELGEIQNVQAILMTWFSNNHPIHRHRGVAAPDARVDSVEEYMDVQNKLAKLLQAVNKDNYSWSEPSREYIN